MFLWVETDSGAPAHWNATVYQKAPLRASRPEVPVVHSALLMSVRHLVSRIPPSLCCLLMAVPVLLWIALDRAPFGGDQSQYATEAVVLFDTLIHSPSRWPSAMAHTMGFKPPPSGLPKDIAVGDTVSFEFRQSKEGPFEIVAMSKAAK